MKGEEGIGHRWVISVEEGVCIDIIRKHIQESCPRAVASSSYLTN